MNLAIGTLLLFLLVIPGMAFRSAYFFGPLTKKYSKSSAFDDFIGAIIPGLFFQFVFAYLINECHSTYYVDFVSLGKILFSSQSAPEEFGKIGSHLQQIIYYNLSLIIIAAFLGFLFRIIIRGFHLDHSCKIFRFNNEWFYTIRGEFIFFSENISREKKIESKRQFKEDLKKIKTLKEWLKFRTERLKSFLNRNQDLACTIHAVVKSDEGACYIYTGIIQSFYLLKDGSLDTIQITGARRRRFFQLEEPSAYSIPTSVVVLKNSEIITISVNVLKANSGKYKSIIPDIESVSLSDTNMSDVEPAKLD